MSDTIQLSKEAESVVAQVLDFSRTQIALYGERGESSMYATLMKHDDGPEYSKAKRSSQGVSVGRRSHPFDFSAVAALQTQNEHHSTCLKTKVSSIVGLGHRMDEGEQSKVDTNGKPIKPKFKLSKVDLALNPLCEHSWQDTLNDAAEDYVQLGNGYLEIVRRSTSRTMVSSAGSSTVKEGAITGIYHLPASTAYVYVENAYYDRHYEIVNGEGAGLSRHFARFGDKQDFLRRIEAGVIAPEAVFDAPEGENASDLVSEIIHFRKPSSLSRWYGFPDWLAAVVVIELAKCLKQHKYDFFNNRGVPEFMLFIMGQKLSSEDWKKVENALKANIGLGNAFKSLALNLDSETIKVQLEKLMAESQEDEFPKLYDSFAMSIVTAHRTPPLLAGIMIPGKLGASNELVNAMKAFQTLVIGPEQRVLQQTLGMTLGNPKMNGGLPLSVEDFEFRTITDYIDLEQTDTISRMRQPLNEAKAQGRDLNAGVKD